MPRSQAWQATLEKRAALYRLLALAETQSSALGDGRQISDQEELLRLAMVTLIGHAQRYIYDVLNELCGMLPLDWISLKPFQKRFVAVQVRRRVEAVLTDTPEERMTDPDIVESFSVKIKEALDWLNEPNKVASSGYKEDLHGFLKNNGSKAFDRALSQFSEDGMHFSAWLQSQHARYRGFLEILDNAVNLRNEVAHGTIGQRITIRDFRLYIVQILRTLHKADEYLESKGAFS